MNLDAKDYAQLRDALVAAGLRLIDEDDDFEWWTRQLADGRFVDVKVMVSE